MFKERPTTVTKDDWKRLLKWASIIPFLLIILWIFSSCQGDRRTPEERAQIDSIEARLVEAPATSVIEFKDGRLDILQRTDEVRAYFILNTGREDKFRTKGIGWVTPDIKEIYPPSHPCHEIMVLNAVDKLAAYQVDSDTVGNRECPEQKPNEEGE